MAALKPNDQRAKNIILLLWIILALHAISAISGYFQYLLLDGIKQGQMCTPEEANANDLRERIIGVISILAYIVSIVFFIQWFRRAYYNLHQRVKNLLHTDKEAVWAWFIPIICLYRPYQVMKEIFTETQKEFDKNNVTPIASLSTLIIGFWWGLWIVNNIVGNISFRTSMNAESIIQLINSTIFSIISDGIGIPLCIITIVMIKTYSSVEAQFAELPENNQPVSVVEPSTIEDTSETSHS